SACRGARARRCRTSRRRSRRAARRGACASRLQCAPAPRRVPCGHDRAWPRDLLRRDMSEGLTLGCGPAWRVSWLFVAVRSVSGGGLEARGTVLQRAVAAPGAVVLALALPLVFLHVDYQPGVTVHAGSTDAHVYLSDLAVLAVGLAALVAGLRHGF